MSSQISLLRPDLIAGFVPPQFLVRCQCPSGRASLGFLPAGEVLVGGVWEVMDLVEGSLFTMRLEPGSAG